MRLEQQQTTLWTCILSILSALHTTFKTISDWTLCGPRLGQCFLPRKVWLDTRFYFGKEVNNYVFCVRVWYIDVVGKYSIKNVHWIWSYVLQRKYDLHIHLKKLIKLLNSISKLCSCLGVNVTRMVCEYQAKVSQVTFSREPIVTPNKTLSLISISRIKNRYDSNGSGSSYKTQAHPYFVHWNCTLIFMCRQEKISTEVFSVIPICIQAL